MEQYDEISETNHFVEGLRMLAIAALGRVAIPENILAVLPAAFDSWPRDRSDVWEIPQKRWHDSPTSGKPYLSDEVVSFVDSTLINFGIKVWEPESHSLVLFDDVTAHSDNDVICEARPGAFFHVVLEGTGVLHMPGLADKAARTLQLEPGLAFWFNPKFTHAVKNACPKGIATLSVTVRVDPIRT